MTEQTFIRYGRKNRDNRNEMEQQMSSLYAAFGIMHDDHAEERAGEKVESYR